MKPRPKRLLALFAPSLVFVSLALATASPAQSQPQSQSQQQPRTRVLFNDGWLFQKGDPAGAGTGDALRHDNVRDLIIHTGDNLLNYKRYGHFWADRFKSVLVEGRGNVTATMRKQPFG